MKCVTHDQRGVCTKACGEVFISPCEALGVDWRAMATPHEWPPRSGFVLPAIERGWGHTYYWPVDLPPLYKDCSNYPLAWAHFIGVNQAELPSGEIDPSKWGPHIAQRVQHVAFTLKHPELCHGGFGLGMYTGESRVSRTVPVENRSESDGCVSLLLWCIFLTGSGFLCALSLRAAGSAGVVEPGLRFHREPARRRCHARRGDLHRHRARLRTAGAPR